MLYILAQKHAGALLDTTTASKSYTPKDTNTLQRAMHVRMFIRVQLPHLLSCLQDLGRGAPERPYLFRLAAVHTVALGIIVFDELAIRRSLRLAQRCLSLVFHSRAGDKENEEDVVKRSVSATGYSKTCLSRQASSYATVKAFVLVVLAICLLVHLVIYVCVYLEVGHNHLV